MRAILLTSLTAVLCLAASVRADKIGPPESYKRVSADKKFVFVMLAPKAESVDGYKRSGMYKNDGSTEPLWAVDWYRRSAAITADGAYVIRYGGPHTYEERLNPDRSMRVVTGKDLKKEALAIVAKGKVVREFSIGDFADDPKALTKGATFFHWQKAVKLNEGKGQLEVTTLDGNHVLIDLATGKIIEKKKLP
jgi:hypothetical protein